MLTSTSQSDCDNCGMPLEGEYCHQCGQRKIDFKKDWHGIFHESLSSLFNFDGKLLRGIFGLTFYPGVITKRFLTGKRVSQIPPLRAYLFISLLFFFYISLVQNVYDNDEVVQINETVNMADVDEDDWFEQWIVECLIDNRDAILDSFWQWLPRAFLIGVLFLALVLRVVLFRSGLLYIEQLVVALNLQSFIFLWGLFVSGWFHLIELWNPDVAGSFKQIAMIWIFVCPFIALKNIFSMGWIKAFFLTGMIEFFYFIYLGFLLLSVLLVSALLA